MKLALKYSEITFSNKSCLLSKQIHRALNCLMPTYPVKSRWYDSLVSSEKPKMKSNICGSCSRDTSSKEIYLNKWGVKCSLSSPQQLLLLFYHLAMDRQSNFFLTQTVHYAGAAQGRRWDLIFSGALRSYEIWSIFLLRFVYSTQRWTRSSYCHLRPSLKCDEFCA